MIKLSIESYIRQGIQACIDEIIREETEKVTEKVKEKVKASAGNIAVKLSTLFHVQMQRDEIIVTFKEEDVRREKK